MMYEIGKWLMFGGGIAFFNGFFLMLVSELI